jgi:ABC-type amino acid transport substrate-binding protein
MRWFLTRQQSSTMPGTKGLGKVSVVGPLFDIQYYGFLFPQGSELREPVNRALLKLRTNGIYDKLYSKWFGSY